MPAELVATHSYLPWSDSSLLSICNAPVGGTQEKTWVMVHGECGLGRGGLDNKYSPSCSGSPGPQHRAWVASRKLFLMSQVPLSKNQECVLRSKSHPGAVHRVPTTVPSLRLVTSNHAYQHSCSQSLQTHRSGIPKQAHQTRAWDTITSSLALGPGAQQPRAALPPSPILPLPC